MNKHAFELGINEFLKEAASIKPSKLNVIPLAGRSGGAMVDDFMTPKYRRFAARANRSADVAQLRARRSGNPQYGVNKRLPHYLREPKS
jgi:hypothetical protein